MDSTRDTVVVSHAVIQPSFWATLIEPPPRWPCIARSFEPYNETDDLLLKASLQFECLWEEPMQQATKDAIDGLLLQTSQQFEWSFVVPKALFTKQIKAQAKPSSCLVCNLAHKYATFIQPLVMRLKLI